MARLYFTNPDTFWGWVGKIVGLHHIEDGNGNTVQGTSVTCKNGAQDKMTLMQRVEMNVKISQNMAADWKWDGVTPVTTDNGESPIELACRAAKANPPQR